MAFNPNHLTFQQGIDRINKARQQFGAHLTKHQILTSRDSGMLPLLQALKVTNIPGGFEKVQLPVYFDGGPGSQFFISIGAPNVDVAKHSHDEGDGMRIILGGSIHYGKDELTQGDWMFIPKGTPYAFRTGALGAIICYCYQCCCA